MLDDYSPPVKRLKLQPNNRLSRDLNNNKENIDPKCVVTCQHEVVRKRKIPVRRPMQPNLLDLNTDVLLEIVDYLPVADLCSVAETSTRMSRIAKRSFEHRFVNGFQMRLNSTADFMLLKRLYDNFGDLFSAITVSIRR